MERVIIHLYGTYITEERHTQFLDVGVFLFQTVAACFCLYLAAVETVFCQKSIAGVHFKNTVYFADAYTGNLK